MTGRTMFALALLTFVAARPAMAQGGLSAGHAAAGRGDWAEAWLAYRSAYDPAEDDPRVVAALAAAAEGLGEPDRFLALADSGVAAHEAPHLRAHRGAALLRTGEDVDDVVAEWRAWLDAGAGRAGHAPLFARVLQGHGAFAPAESLLAATQARAGPSPGLALALGDVRAARGDRPGAVDAWAGALAGPGAALAASRIETLVDGMIEEGAWVPAMHAAGSLPPSSRAARLRETARAALAAGDRAAARGAAERLAGMGSPWTRAADQRLLEEIVGRGAPAGTGSPERSPAGLLAALDAARGTGDPDAIAAAMERARAGGVGDAFLAVPAGDLWLARGEADSALAAYGRAVDGPTRVAIEALGRFRLVRWLLERPGGGAIGEVGRALVEAPVRPGDSARTVETLAGGDSLDVGGSILLALAGEWRGRSGDAAGASRALEAAARRAPAGEAAALLLAAGRWAGEAGELERARALWREVALDHAATPYALEARRRLEDAEETG